MQKRTARKQSSRSGQRDGRQRGLRGGVRSVSRKSLRQRSLRRRWVRVWRLHWRRQRAESDGWQDGSSGRGGRRASPNDPLGRSESPLRTRLIDSVLRRRWERQRLFALLIPGTGNGPSSQQLRAAHTQLHCHFHRRNVALLNGRRSRGCGLAGARLARAVEEVEAGEDGSTTAAARQVGVVHRRGGHAVLVRHVTARQRLTPSTHLPLTERAPCLSCCHTRLQPRPVNRPRQRRQGRRQIGVEGLPPLPVELQKKVVVRRAQLPPLQLLREVSGGGGGPATGHLPADACGLSRCAADERVGVRCGGGGGGGKGAGQVVEAALAEVVVAVDAAVQRLVTGDRQSAAAAAPAPLWRRGRGTRAALGDGRRG